MRCELEQEGFDSRASHRWAQESRPLPVRIGFPKDAEEKASGIPNDRFTSASSEPRAPGCSEAGLWFLAYAFTRGS